MADPFHQKQFQMNMDTIAAICMGKPLPPMEDEPEIPEAQIGTCENEHCLARVHVKELHRNAGICDYCACGMGGT